MRTRKSRPILALLAVVAGGIFFLWQPSADAPSGLAAQLRAYVTRLSTVDPPRSYRHPESLKNVAHFIQGEFRDIGLPARLQTFTVQGSEYHNVRAFLGPESAPRVVVGAHYDVAGDLPGADDNASGVAGLIELARRLKKDPPPKTVEFVAYTLEEPPFFRSANMGSARHAALLASQKIRVDAMISLEMLGYYDDGEGSQRFPDGLEATMAEKYPGTGNFIAVIGRSQDTALANRIQTSINEAVGNTVRAYKLNLPDIPLVTDVISLSDHRNYWKHGYTAVMITDTAMFRNPNYHEASDTAGTLDYERMAELVQALEKAVRDVCENN